MAKCSVCQSLIICSIFAEVSPGLYKSLVVPQDYSWQCLPYTPSTDTSMAAANYPLTLADPSLLDSLVQNVNEVLRDANIDKVTLVYHDKPGGRQPCDLRVEVSTTSRYQYRMNE